jgi:hypothetical protein
MPGIEEPMAFLRLEYAEETKEWKLRRVYGKHEIVTAIEHKGRYLYLRLEKTVADPENALAGESVPMTGNVATSSAWRRIQLSRSGKFESCAPQARRARKVLAESVRQTLFLRELLPTAAENAAVAAALSAGRRAARECARMPSPRRP